MKTETAKAASEIRKELKANFPGVKFSVRSSSFAGGTSIRIEYTDGPKRADVEAIVNKYEYGSFDGMTDSYNYDNVREDIPQAKYVSVDRNMSEEVRCFLTGWVEERFLSENGFTDYDRSRQIRIEFENISKPELLFI